MTARRLVSTVALVVFLVAAVFALRPLPDGKVLHVSDSGLKSFIFDNHARLLRLTFKENQEKLSSFSKYYKLAAGQLKKFDVQLGQLNCDLHPTFEFCTRPNAGLYLYGFRGSLKEKLALPVSTLADENAIVASALHLELIQIVPIIQTVIELDDLYNKCFKKCDIVLSYHNTLGTREHSLFLSFAMRLHSPDRVFALSTSGLASPLKQETLSEKDAKHSVQLWLVQCKKNNCEHSTFAASFQEQTLEKYIASLDLPLWIQLDGPMSENLDGQMLRYSQLILIFDHKSKKRVTTLATTLAVTFRGALFVSVASVEDFRQKIHRANEFTIAPPSVMFVPFRNGTLLEIKDGVIQNGLENINNFVRDQIMYEENKILMRQNKKSDYMTRFSTRNIEEAPVKDDLEMSYSAIRDFIKRSSQCLSRPKDLTIKIYYLQWDEVSQLMLKLLDYVELVLEMLPVRTVSRVNCFTDRDDCEHEHTYPTLEFSDSRKSMQTGSLSWTQLMRLIYTFGADQRVREINRLDDLLNELDDPRYEFVEAVGHIVDTEKLIQVPKIRSNKFGLDLILTYGEAAQYLMDKLNCTETPCFGIQKFGDDHEPLVTFPGRFDPDDFSLKEFISKHKYPILPELSAENLARLRSKLVVIALGVEPTRSISESARRAAGGPVAFSYIARRAAYFERVRRTHLPASVDAGLVALNLTLGCSFLYQGDLRDGQEIERWIGGILLEQVQPTAYLAEKQWTPSAPAIDYLALSERQPEQSDAPSSNGDTDDLFIARDADLLLGAA